MGIFWKKTGLVCIVLTALAIVGYAQTTKQPQRARSTNLQTASGYLGVGLEDLDADRAKALNLKDSSGVLVSGLVPGQAGALAGMRMGDVIVEFDGQKIEDKESFQKSIIAKSPGTKINLTVMRGGTKQVIAATLGVRPLDLPMGSGPAVQPSDLLQMMTAAAGALAGPTAGFDCESLTAQLAEFFGVQEGVLVRQVFSRTPEERAGLKAGDIVTKVNGFPVASPREILAIVRQMNKKIVVFTVVRNKKEITLNVEVAWNLGVSGGIFSGADPSDPRVYHLTDN